MRKASIVIRCYNEETHIGRLLSGIVQQTVKDVEIVVVDSGSTDATVTIASRYPVRIVSISPDQFSFGRSLNLGCAEATGEFIVACSAHVYPVYRDWLENLLRPFEDPEVALSYGKQRGNDVTKYSEHQVFAKWFPEDSDFNQVTPFCNNANAAVRRSVWQQLPYDEDLTGLEDVDWAKRVKQNQMKIAYAAEAEVIHVHEETPLRIYNRYRREAIALKRIFPHETFSFLDFVRLLVTNVWSDYHHAVHEKVLWRNLYSIPMFRLMQFWGGYRGFAQHGPITSDLKKTFYFPRVRRSVPDPQIPSNENRAVVDYSHLP